MTAQEARGVTSSFMTSYSTAEMANAVTSWTSDGRRAVTHVVTAAYRVPGDDRRLFQRTSNSPISNTEFAADVTSATYPQTTQYEQLQRRVGDVIEYYERDFRTTVDNNNADTDRSLSFAVGGL